MLALFSSCTRLSARPQGAAEASQQSQQIEKSDHGQVGDQVAKGHQNEGQIHHPHQDKNKSLDLTSSPSKSKKDDFKKIHRATQSAGKEKEESEEMAEPQSQQDSVAELRAYPEDFPELFKQYDQVSVKVWEKFKSPLIPGESAKFNIKYFGVVCGTITFKILPNKMIGQKETFHIYANMKSAPFYKYIYTLDDTIEAFVEVGNFLPVKYSLVQRESGQTADDLQLFDSDKLKSYFWFKRLKKGEVKRIHEITYMPRLAQDSFSALLFVRGLPLITGDLYEVPIVTRGKVWLLKVAVVGEEEVTVAKKKMKAIKIKAETHYPGILKKRGDILFWYSHDPSHKLLKFSAKVKIGTVEDEALDEPTE